MRLETIEVDRYGPLRSRYPECSDGLTVIAGPNESGKTLYLEAILRLLDSGVTDGNLSSPRVDASPAGRITVSNGSEQHTLENGTSLGDVSSIDANHLTNLFVVRDSDLALPTGQGYYTTLVEHLGNIHTTEIERINDVLLDEGRLTGKNLNLSSAGWNNNAEDVRNDARQLERDVGEYLEQIREEGIEEVARDRLSAKRELNEVTERLETLRDAETVARHRDLTERLEDYETATEQLDELADVDSDTLTELRRLDQNRASKHDELQRLNQKRASKREEVQKQRDRLDDLRERRSELERRESAVEELETAIDRYRDRAQSVTVEDATLGRRRAALVGGLVGGGLAVGGGALAGSIVAIALGVVLLVVAGVAAYSHRQLTQKAEDVEQRERELVADARDTGFEVSDVTDVAPSVRSYRDELESVREDARKVETNRDAAQERVEELDGDIEKREHEIGELDGEIDERLGEANVESIEEYDEVVDKREDAVRRRDTTERDLKQAFGEPSDDSQMSKATYWETELGGLVDEVDQDIEADQYDEGKLERLENREGELEDRLEELSSRLDSYNDKLDEFQRRAAEVTAEPFVGDQIRLEARTPAGLEALHDELGELVSTIERDADQYRKAVELFREIRDEEAQKLGSLFDPDGPASETFARLTGGRYTGVDYDPEAGSLEVAGSDGERLSPYQLSRGTQDQLYFSARLSLAKQLLGGEPGFLLLDDPFLAADPDRLRRGFETLGELVSDGWQVLYLTAKQEVYETMAPEFDCRLERFEPLE